MIIIRSPLRISLGGGGTDLPSYYERFGGELVAAAINKYVYIVLQNSFVSKIMLRYSKIEEVENVSDIRHPIIRAVLNKYGYTNEKLEITSFADVPSGTGLGSSSSFTAALLKSMHVAKRLVHTKEALAKEACHIEIDLLKEPIGKQDQYATTYGGIGHFKFLSNGEVTSTPLELPDEVYNQLSENLVLYSTGHQRSAGAILQDQNNKSKKDDQDMLKNLHYNKEIGQMSKNCMLKGDLEEFGRLLHEHWENKKKRSPQMTNSRINDLYELGRKNGAIGGKVIGAGGGGFLMFYANDVHKLKKVMKDHKIPQLNFSFDFEGTKVLQS